MSEPLVVIIVDRDNGKINYRVNCANNVTSEELAHYLDEIIEGICTWKPGVCEETVQTIIGTIKEKKSKPKTS
jgi:hypothetical protein